MDLSGKQREQPSETTSGKMVPAESVSYLQPRSKSDADWLKEHGFPTPDELAGIDQLSMQSLAERAARGDRAAQSLLALKQFEAGQVLEGYANLQDAAVHGSIFAMHVLAERMAEKGNQAEALAWFQVAGMRGDFSAADRVSGLGWPALNPFAVGRSQRYALRYFENLSLERGRLGLGPFVNRVRPGSGDSAAKPGEFVAVYEPPAG